MVRGFLTRKRIRNMQYSGYDNRNEDEPNYDNQKVLVSKILLFQLFTYIHHLNRK